jgi:hypothetical protein
VALVKLSYLVPWAGCGENLYNLYYYAVECCFPARLFSHGERRGTEALMEKGIRRLYLLVVEANCAKGCRQAVGTTGSTTKTVPWTHAPGATFRLFSLLNLQACGLLD